MIVESGNPDGAAPGTTSLLVIVRSVTTVFGPLEVAAGGAGPRNATPTARESASGWRTKLLSSSRVAWVRAWRTELTAAPPADPATGGVPIRWPEMVPT